MYVVASISVVQNQGKSLKLINKIDFLKTVIEPKISVGFFIQTKEKLQCVFQIKEMKINLMKPQSKIFIKHLLKEVDLILIKIFIKPLTL